MVGPKIKKGLLSKQTFQCGYDELNVLRNVEIELRIAVLVTFLTVHHTLFMLFVTERAT